MYSMEGLGCNCYTCEVLFQGQHIKYFFGLKSLCSVNKYLGYTHKALIKKVCAVYLSAESYHENVTIKSVVC